MKNIGTFLWQKPTLISILLGATLVVWQFFNGSLTPSVQIAFFSIFIFSTGIPHGAIDHLVESETARRKQIRFKMLPFLIKYVASMLIYASFWWLFPTPSLGLFLLISAWHFGETDIENAPNTLLWHSTRFIFGHLVIWFLLLTHAEEITPLWSRIVRGETQAVHFWQFMTANRLLMLMIGSSVFGLLLFLAYWQKPYKIKSQHIFQLTIILCLTYFLPLLPAFALYFGGWHALCSFQSIQQYLNRSSTTHQNNSSENKSNIWLKALPFSFAAFVFLFAAFYLWSRFLSNWDPIPLIFIFLSLITLPHLRVMHGMNKLLNA